MDSSSSFHELHLPRFFSMDFYYPRYASSSRFYQKIHGQKNWYIHQHRDSDTLSECHQAQQISNQNFTVSPSHLVSLIIGQLQLAATRRSLQLATHQAGITLDFTRIIPDV